MNVFEKIHAAADSIGIYSCPDVKSEKVKRKTWITYNIYYEQGRMYGDDEAHIFSCRNRRIFFTSASASGMP